MRNIRFITRYDGSHFQGWQTQRNMRTVQQTLEETIALIILEKVHVVGSGRTDSGVHALFQVCNFKCNNLIPTPALLKGVNAKLAENNKDVSIIYMDEVDDTFCSIRSATCKTYRYYIRNSPRHDPFALKTAWHIRVKLDAEAMNAACPYLIGRHDFRSFETHWPNRWTSVRHITHLSVRQTGPLITIEVSADGFLYNMVRAIVGTLVQVGKGRFPPEWVGNVLAAFDRREAGPNAPPEGLFLCHVEYPEPWTLPDISHDRIPLAD